MNETMTVAQEIAQKLLQIKAIKLQPLQPFTWASGWKSPIYCDNRIALSHPEVRSYIKHALVDAIKENFGKPQLIAGVATAAIAQGALVADLMNTSFVYVRSSPKDHGRENLIEGEISGQPQCVVIEDLVSTGMSSLKAVDALRNAGCNIAGMICVFNYGFNVAKNNFAKTNCPLVSLCNYEQLIPQAIASGYVSEKENELLSAWRNNPESWGKNQ